MSIKKQPNGKYFLYTVDARDRKVRLRFDRKEDAEALEAMIRKEKYDKKLVKVGLRKAQFWFSECVEDFRKTKALLQPKSVQKYDAVIKHFRVFGEKLGIKEIDDFTPEHATLYYNELIREVEVTKKDKSDPKKEITELVRSAPKTINFYIQTIKAFFQEEVIKDHIVKSPMLHLKNLKVHKKQPEFYSNEELKKIFSQEMTLEYRQFFLGLLYSGLRFSEAANLTWDNVDFQNKLIFIKPTKGHKLKTENAERGIKIPKVLLDLLQAMFENKKSDFVFCTSSGTKMRERKALSVCKDVAEKAELSSRAFLHKFRATYATVLVRNKVPLETIKELLGHSSVTITEKSYANNVSAGMFADVDVLDNIFD